MTLETIVIWIVVGALAGWIAGLIVRGFSFGLLGNIIIGIIGAIVGGWLFGMAGIVLASGILNTILTAIIGAIVVLLVVRLLKRA